jgi:ABC-type transporter Mla subunit MlaD
LNNEIKALDYIGKSELTTKIVEQDRKRDDIYRGFVDSLRGAAKHFDPSYRDAANLLLNIFGHYGNIARKTLDDETAAINDLVRELEQPQLTQAIALLGMNDWLNKLVEENNAFEELMKERYSETASKTTFRMRAVRVETDKYYHAIISQIENQCLAGIEINENFIRELNAVIERFKRILAQEVGERKPKTISN